MALKLITFTLPLFKKKKQRQKNVNFHDYYQQEYLIFMLRSEKDNKGFLKGILVILINQNFC